MLGRVCLLLPCILAVSFGEHFSDVVSDYWAWRQEDAPEFATQIGNHTYDDRVEQYTIDVLDKRKVKVDGFRQRLQQISRDTLGPSDRVSYDVLKDTLETYLAGYKWKNYGPMNPVNFLEGLLNNPEGLIPTNLKTKEEIFGFVTRIFGWADQALNMMIRMREAIRENTTNHQVSMNGVNQQIDSFIGNSTEENVFFEAVQEMVDQTTLSDNDKNELMGMANLTVKQLRTTYGTLKRFILEEYTPNTRRAYGVSSMRDGGEYYKACLKWHLSTDHTPEQVHQLGLKEVDRIHKQMTQVVKKLGYTGTVREFFVNISMDPRFLLKTPEEIIERFNDIIFKRVQPKLKTYFRNVPNMPVTVKKLPNDGPAGMYSHGTPDGSTPGIFYANTIRPENNPTYDMVALTLHEADPGHHLQDIYAQTAKGLPVFRKVTDTEKYFSIPLHFPFYTAYLEGWGLYAESLGEKEHLNIYQDDYELMGRYSAEIFRACRLVVDTGLHYYNWTRQRAIDYIMNYTSTSEHGITIEIDRYITWPGQACAYKIGELKIKELRSKAQTELGDYFDIRDFHSLVLDNGPVPLKLLEQLVDNWVAKTKAKSVSEQFSDLVSDYWIWRMEDSPEFATQSDNHKYDGKVEQYTVDVLDQRKEMVDLYLRRLNALSRDALEPSEQVSYDVLKDTLETFLAGYKWKNYGPMNPVNFLEGLWNDPEALLPASLETEGEFLDLIRRISGWAEQALNLIGRMRVAIRENTADHVVSINDAVPQIDVLIGNSTKENVIFKAFEDLVQKSNLTNNEKANLISKANVSVEHLRTSYDTLKSFILTEYKPHTRQSYGVSSLRDGGEYYKACLKWHLSTDHTPEQVHQLGLKEVTRIHAQMAQVVKRLGYNGTVREFFNTIVKDPRFLIQSQEETLKRFNDLIFNRIQPKLSKFFRNIPDMPVKVERMKNDGPGGSYRFGSPDGSRPGIFYANTIRPEYNPTYDMVALVLHEADPGHHLQDIYSQSAKGLSMFRKIVDDSKYFSPPLHFPIYTAYLEGWALYAESLGEKDQLNVYADDYELMGRYSSEIFRACRLVVDTGLHYYNWTRQDSIDYLVNYTSYSEHAMTVEIDRYITWPGQACAYKIGELKIKELRSRAQTELGGTLDIRDFHSLVLDNGAVPLKLLEQLVDDWIATEKAKSVSELFSDLVSDYWDWRMEDSPEFATQSDNHKYDGKVEQYTVDVLDQRKEMVDIYLRRLNALSRDALEPSDRISYDVLKDTLETYLAGYKWKNYGPMNPVNFLEGLWNDPEALLPASLETEGEFLELIRRISGWAEQALKLIERMRVAIRENTTDHWVSINDAVPQIDDLIGKSTEENVIFKAFRDLVEKSNMTQFYKAKLISEAMLSVGNLRTSYDTLKSFILKEYKPHTRQSYGVSSMRDGGEYYKACLKWHLSTDHTPEQVHQLGLKEVDRIHAQMTQVVSRLGYNETVEKFFNTIAKDPRFLLTSEEETIERYNDLIFNRVQPKLSKFFRDIPSMPVKVERMPNDGPAGSYRFGSPDGSRPGIFYANTKRHNPTYDMLVLVLHESDPGHHLQDIYSQSAKGLSMFRKVVDDSKYFSPPLHFPIYTAYLEGWGLYAESLGEKDQLDLYKDDYELMGRYRHEIFRACRLVVDTGLHNYNWTRQQAIDYMVNYTSYSQHAMTVEIDRYITWPGQACAYKVGELKIKELRSRAQAELGDKFDIRDFHSLVLDNGAVPLKLLEQLVDDWIATGKDTLDKVMMDFFSWRLKSSPEFATDFTYKYNDKLDDFSYDMFDSQLAEAKTFLMRLLTTDDASLSDEKRTSYDVLKNILETFIDGYKWRNYGALNPFGFITNYFEDVGGFVDNLPMDTQGDVINVLRRLELAPNQLDEMVALSKKAIKLGHTTHNVTVSRLPGLLNPFINQTAKDTKMYETIQKAFGRVFGQNRGNLNKRLQEAVRQFQLKLKYVVTFLETEYMPHSRAGIGWSYLAGGSEYYQACLKWHTSLDITPEEVHTKGLAEVKRISGLMKTTMKKLGFPVTANFGEVYKNMSSDKTFLLDSGEATLERFRQIIFDRVRPKISQYFRNYPNLPLEVKPSPADGIGGMYQTGSEDGSRPGVFYANVRRPTDNPTYTMVSLSLHEAIPGHHLAESYSIVSDIPDFRKHMQWKAYNAPYFFPFFNSFVEGWALYAEYLGEEMGAYHDDSELMGRYSEEMWRACRLVVDTGIHYYNWTRERAVTYMLDHTAQGRESAEIEVDRYSTWPGQACGYKLGELKIKELRRKAEQALGEEFDVREFHYAILKNGAMPLDVLERVVDNWIDSVKSSSTKVVIKPCPPSISSSGIMFRFSYVCLTVQLGAILAIIKF